MSNTLGAGMSTRVGREVRGIRLAVLCFSGFRWMALNLFSERLHSALGNRNAGQEQTYSVVSNARVSVPKSFSSTPRRLGSCEAADEK